MSSGYNGIPIRSVGRTRIKLAAMLNEKLALGPFERIRPEDIRRSNPHHRCWEDSIAWECYILSIPNRRVYSWAKMTQLVREGFTIDDPKANEIEI